MWLVTYLGLMLAPVLALGTSLLAIRIGKGRKDQAWSTTWTILASLLGASILLGVLLGVEGGQTNQIGAAIGFGLLFILAWLGAAGLSVGAGVLGIIAGRRWRSRLLLGLAAGVLALIFVLPAVNWAADKVGATIPASPTERFPFRLYEPTYVPDGYSKQNVSVNDEFSGNGFPAVSDETVRYVEWTYGTDERTGPGRGLLKPNYRLKEFSAAYGQRDSDGCFDQDPHRSPDPEATPDTFPGETVVCSQAGTMPSGQPIYVERIGPITLTTTEVDRTVLVINHAVGVPAAESDSVRILQSVREVDRKEFRDRLEAAQRERDRQRQRRQQR